MNVKSFLNQQNTLAFVSLPQQSPPTSNTARPRPPEKKQKQIQTKKNNNNVFEIYFIHWQWQMKYRSSY